MSIPIYLVVAYAVFWTLPFILILSIWARQRRLEREITTLERLLDKREQTTK